MVTVNMLVWIHAFSKLSFNPPNLNIVFETYWINELWYHNSKPLVFGTSLQLCFTVMVKHIFGYLPVTLRNLNTVIPLNHQPWPQHSVGWPHHGRILADVTSLDHMLLLGQFSVFSENPTNLHVSNFTHRNFNNK